MGDIQVATAAEVGPVAIIAGADDALAAPGETSTAQADKAVHAEIKQQVLNRLKRARGQLDAVIKAVNADSDCRSVVIQLAAVGSAVERTGFVIVASGMKHCLADDSGTTTPDSPSIQEMEKLFMMLR